jgi:hypothetical protein
VDAGKIKERVMNVPRQLELFADGARAVAVAAQRPMLQRTEADLQAKLDTARARLHEIVVLGTKTWLAVETLRGLQAETWRRREVRLHIQVLERLRQEQRRREVGGTSRCEEIRKRRQKSSGSRRSFCLAK